MAIAALITWIVTRPDRYGDQDRVKRVAIGAREDGDRFLSPAHGLHRNLPRNPNARRYALIIPLWQRIINDHGVLLLR